MVNSDALIASNIKIKGSGYDYVFGATFCNDIQLSNFYWENIGIDFIRDPGTAGKRIHLTNGQYVNCILPYAAFNADFTITDNVVAIGGASSLFSRKRGSLTATTNSNGNISIPHGLYAAPTWAQVSSVGDVTYQAAVETIDATNVVVRIADMVSGGDVVGTSVTVHWEAEVT